MIRDASHSPLGSRSRNQNPEKQIRKIEMPLLPSSTPFDRDAVRSRRRSIAKPFDRDAVRSRSRSIATPFDREADRSRSRSIGQVRQLDEPGAPIIQSLSISS
jgi:hypothetical protein